MSFASFSFLVFFLPLFLYLRLLTPARGRLALLVGGSAVFFTWASPLGFLTTLAGGVVHYLLGCAVARAKRDSVRRGFTALSVFLSLATLFYFKYLPFLAAEISSALIARGLPPIHWTSSAYPLGISFIVFHQISWAVDLFRRRAAPQGFGAFLGYLLMFPKLIQGPLLRYGDFAGDRVDEIPERRVFLAGAGRAAVGLAKKALIADPLGRTVAAVFALPYATLRPDHAWLGALAFTFQIYFDFSGYTDIAIGVGQMCGLRMPENFDRPYIAMNFTDFWRRWHITLSQWFREYLYIPLGGNRRSAGRTYLNLWIVFLLSGLWHGANWTFLFWGFYHGMFLVCDRIFWRRASRRLGAPVNAALTFVLVAIGWVFFRADSMAQAFAVVGRMFGLFWPAGAETSTLTADLIDNRGWAVLAAAAAISFCPEAWRLRARAWLKPDGSPARRRATLAGAAAACLFVLSVMAMASRGFLPFLYNRF